MKKTIWLSGIAAMALFSFSVLAAEPNIPGQGGRTEDQTLLAAEPNPLPPGEYWLGIECHPVAPALRAQLHLPENQGIVVEAIMPDSPAAKAGLAQYDVILKADGKKLSDVPDLQQAVGAAKEKEIKLEIIRDGQPKTITITPAKRPEEFQPQVDVTGYNNLIEQLQKTLQQMQINPGPMQFWSFRPGVILPPGALVHPPLPGNMSIIISKTGDKPADITVKLDDKKWEVSEKDLNKLPEKVRPFVERMLGSTGAMGGGAIRWMPEMLPPSSPPGPGMPAGAGGAGFRFGQGPNMNGPPWNNLERRIDKRLEEMQQRMEKLENELLERHPALKAPEQPQPPEKNEGPTSEKTAL